MADVHATTARRSASWHGGFLEDNVAHDVTPTSRWSAAGYRGSDFVHWHNFAVQGRKDSCPVTLLHSPQVSFASTGQVDPLLASAVSCSRNVAPLSPCGELRELISYSPVLSC